MQKKINIIALFIFFAVTLVTPFITAKSSATAFNQTTEERDIFANQIFEEEIHNEELPEFFVTTFVVSLTFICHLSLRPQSVHDDLFRPPMV